MRRQIARPLQQLKDQINCIPTFPRINLKLPKLKKPKKPGLKKTIKWIAYETILASIRFEP